MGGATGGGGEGERRRKKEEEGEEFQRIKKHDHSIPEQGNARRSALVKGWC